MLAIVYLALMLWVGDALCRRFYRFVSVPHRLAAAFLVGSMASSWLTYLAARAFAGTSSPLLWGNLFFFAAAIGGFVWLRRKESGLQIREEEPALESSKAEETSALSPER